MALDRHNGSMIKPAVDETNSKYPLLYKPFKLPGQWYYNINAAFDTSSEEYLTNGYYMAIALTAQGWKYDQMVAILGNISQECTMNGSYWERAKGEPFLPTPLDNYLSMPANHGFGIVQWTPASDMIPWVLEVFGDNGRINADLPSWYNATCQIAMLQYELQTDQQWGWGGSFEPPIRFPHEIDFFNYDFGGEEGLDDAVTSWCYYYERPGDVAVLDRRKQRAHTWYQYLKDKPLKPLPIWMLAKAAKRGGLL